MPGVRVHLSTTGDQKTKKPPAHVVNGILIHAISSAGTVTIISTSIFFFLSFLLLTWSRRATNLSFVVLLQNAALFYAVGVRVDVTVTLVP